MTTDQTKELLQQYLLAAMQKTGNIVDKAVDMVQQQAPILIHEILNWYFTYNLIMCIIGVSIIITSFIIARKGLNAFKNSSASNDPFNYFIVAVSMVPPGLIAANLCNLEWLKIWIAPRLWLIEYTANLVKTGVVGH